MSNTLEFTDDEVVLLHLLLSEDLAASRVELNHTAGLPYRDYVNGRMQRGLALLQKMNAAFPTLQSVDAA
jgi:hypothetical protein